MRFLPDAANQVVSVTIVGNGPGSTCGRPGRSSG